jgi:hypothetical protein
MNATKLHNGAWQMSAMIFDPAEGMWGRERLETYTYMGYNKRDSIALFRAHLIENGYKVTK